ncbi:MAG: hypothetical protein INQ03_13170 [Candidatus Heimdallarchaeota archaeon]|nr:hypothetical protein [Candidatus Heimdallarchaeota archaeon]
MTFTSKVNVKKYFLPVYLVWAVLIPLGLILINAYIQSYPDRSIIDVIEWNRVPAMFALWGFAYPITLVTMVGFFTSFAHQLSFGDLMDSFSYLNASSEELRDRAIMGVVSLIGISIISFGPIIHLVLAFVFHKSFTEKRIEKSLSWSDYLFGFI